MKQFVFEMKLNAGKIAEYKIRHDKIWPEIVLLLNTSNIKDYTIYLNQDTGTIFSIIKISEELGIEMLGNHPIIQKWWILMKDIIQCHPNHSPFSLPLKEVFYLP